MLSREGKHVAHPRACFRQRKHGTLPRIIVICYSPLGPGRRVRQAIIDWQFTTADARIKLKRLYPRIQS